MQVKSLFDKNFKEILGSQIVSVLGGLFAGGILGYYTKNILLIPSMLIILPGFLEMRANISGPLASRLSSGLFLGIVNSKMRAKNNTKILNGNIIASVLLTILACLFLGTLAFLMNYFVFQIYTPKLIFILLFAGIIANAIELPFTLFITFFLFRKGHDPNNIMGPFLTSLGDITSIVALLIALVII